MILNNPVKINNNKIANNGKLITEEITITELYPILIDNNRRKSVVAQLIPFFDTIMLWANEEYDSIGDYTQAQAENRILEILGDDPSNILKNYIFKRERSNGQ